MGLPDQRKLGIHSVGVVHVGDRGGEVLFAGEQDVFGGAREVLFVLVGEGGNGEGVPAEGVGVGEIGSHPHANCADPDPVEAGGDEG